MRLGNPISILVTMGCFMSSPSGLGAIACASTSRPWIRLSRYESKTMKTEQPKPRQDWRRITLAEADIVLAHPNADTNGYTMHGSTLRDQIGWAMIANRDQINPSDSIYVETSVRGTHEIKSILNAAGIKL